MEFSDKPPITSLLLGIFSLCMAVVLFSSCLYNHTAVTEDLGDGYFYLGDGRESQILYNPNHEEGKSNGRIVTEPELVEYNFNSEYIIAKSIRNSNVLYWVIDKKMPVDSIHHMSKEEFERDLVKKKIQLKLKKRK